MDPEFSMPEWAGKLLETLAGTIEFKGPASMEGFFTPSEENSWGVDLLEMAPSVLEIEEAGEYDGEQVYGVINNFDLLAVQEGFDEVDAISFGFDNDGNPHFTLEGKVDGHEVVVVIYTDPYEDMVIDEDEDSLLDELDGDETGEDDGGFPGEDLLG